MGGAKRSERNGPIGDTGFRVLTRAHSTGGLLPRLVRAERLPRTLWRRTRLWLQNGPVDWPHDLDKCLPLGRRPVAISMAVSGNGRYSQRSIIRESDSVRTVTATEASRSFAALLDEVEKGQTVIVTRGGRRIATIGPTTNGNGAEVLALLQSSHADEEFAADLRGPRFRRFRDTRVARRLILDTGCRSRPSAERWRWSPSSDQRRHDRRRHDSCRTLCGHRAR
jgi:prevent-host-death family protein